MDLFMIVGLFISFSAFISAAIIKIYRGIVDTFEPKVEAPASDISTELRKDAEAKKAIADNSQKEAEAAIAKGDEDADVLALKAAEAQKESEDAQKKLEEVEAGDESTGDMKILKEISELMDVVDGQEDIAYSTESDLAPRLDSFDDILTNYDLILVKYDELSGGDFTKDIAEVKAKKDEAVAGKAKVENDIEADKQKQDADKMEEELAETAQEILSMVKCDQLLDTEDGAKVCEERVDCSYSPEVNLCSKNSCSAYNRNETSCRATTGCVWSERNSRVDGRITQCTGNVSENCSAYDDSHEDCNNSMGCSYSFDQSESCKTINCATIDLDKCSDYSSVCEKRDVGYCELNLSQCSLLKEKGCELSGCTSVYETARIPDRSTGEAKKTFKRCEGTPTGSAPTCTPPECKEANYYAACGEYRSKPECVNK